MLERLSEEFDEMAMGRENGNATGLANKLPDLHRDTRNVKERQETSRNVPIVA
jgi:hypothetical protein